MMKLAAALGVAAVMASASLGETKPRIVITSVKGTKISMKVGQIVRVQAWGGEEAVIKAEVLGSKYVLAENLIKEQIDGEAVPPGLVKREFEVKPTKAGDFKIKVTVKDPEAKVKEKTTVYEVEVK